MGAGVSVGENNDDLIDKLVEANFIMTSKVERVFRAVDRGAYFLSDFLVDAYRDMAWKNGNLHISAPCIYGEVMEGLKLEPGLSFLNLGSGTGYLSTVAGLILGSNGINHGIELHEDVIQYARAKLDEFKKYSCAIDEYDFCEPKFIQGNCLCLSSDFHLYDRVYCGAACSEENLSYIKSLVKQGGILIVPINEELLEMKRVTETIWSSRCLLSVSFTSLVTPDRRTQQTVPFFEIKPLSLQELCRTIIRNILRKVIETEHPTVKNIARTKKASKKKKTSNRDVDKYLFYTPVNISRRKMIMSEENGESSDKTPSSSISNYSLRDGDSGHTSSYSEDSNENPSTNESEDDTNTRITTAVIIEIGNKISRSEQFEDVHRTVDEEEDTNETMSNSSDEEQDRKKILNKNDKKRICDDDSDNESEYVKSMKRMKMYISPYTIHMEEKIRQLPLPTNVKKFLHFYRDF